MAQQEQSLMERFKEAVGEAFTELGGNLQAIGRQGAKDLYNAVVPAFPDSAHGVDEPGTPMTPTQFMVNEDLGVHGQDSDRGIGH